MSSDEPHDLHRFMRQVSDETASEYQRIYARAAEDPGTAGDEGEKNWATLLRGWLPPTYGVETKGRILGMHGKPSPQIDIVVLKPGYPEKLREKQMWIAAGVAAAFECKTTMKAKHITDSFERAEKFKAVYPARWGTPRKELTSPLIYGLLCHSHSWKGPNSTPSWKVDRLVREAAGTVKHPKNTVDLMCVADLAAWSSEYLLIETVPEGSTRDQLRSSGEGDASVLTYHTCRSVADNPDANYFSPIGYFISKLITRLAYQDPSIRDFAEYFSILNHGQGGGSPRPWKRNIFSPVLNRTFESGKMPPSKDYWDEWCGISS